MGAKGKDTKHSNGYCIALLIVTFLSFIIGSILTIYGEILPMDLLFYGTILLITVILVMDREHLKEIYPERKIFAGIAVILVPWYLYKRAKFVNERQTFLIIWAFMMVLGAAADYIMDKMNEGLPSCDNRDVTGVLKEIVDNMGLNFVSVANIQELSFDEDFEVRVCHGAITTTYQQEEGQYKIYWGDSSRSYYIVEIVPIYEGYTY